MPHKPKQTSTKQSEETVALENSGRRKAVKTIVSSTAALAAYNVLPTHWETPLVEFGVLPAHAVTSGVTVFTTEIKDMIVEYVEGNETTDTVMVKISGFVDPSHTSVLVKLTATPIIS